MTGPLEKLALQDKRFFIVLKSVAFLIISAFVILPNKTFMEAVDCVVTFGGAFLLGPWMIYRATTWLYDERAKLDTWSNGRPLLVAWTLIVGVAAAFVWMAFIAPGNLIDDWRGLTWYSEPAESRTHRLVATVLVIVGVVWIFNIARWMYKRISAKSN
jgi:hypothetical protein